MSSYNDRLKPISWKGLCGDKEMFEPRSKWMSKAAQLADWIKQSKYTVAFTGAGISTASGIADFRGPKGVWTLEKQGKKCELEVTFESAKPSFTHMALVALMNKGYLHYVVSQNVDGLHLKSGIPRDRLSELHGNLFAEQCDICNTEYIRDFDVGGMGCKPTGRNCNNPACDNAPLRDKAIDWDSPLPEEEFAKAIDAHKQAYVALCLGTSLRIRPAGNMPLRTLRKHSKEFPGKLVIVNLQATHLDRNASMRLHVRTDAIMREVCRLLDVAVDFHDDKADKEDLQEREAFLAQSNGATAAAASSSSSAAAPTAAPKKIKKVKADPTPPTVNRPSRFHTEALRVLYHPTVISQETETMSETSQQVASASAASSTAEKKRSRGESNASAFDTTTSENEYTQPFKMQKLEPESIAAASSAASIKTEQPKEMSSRRPTSIAILFNSP